MIRDETILKAAHDTGITVDLLYWLAQSLTESAFAHLCERVSTEPKYSQSIETPYVSRNRLALLNESLAAPISACE